LEIDEITFHKNTALTTDRSKVKSLINRGAKLTTHENKMGDFANIGLKAVFTAEEAIDRADVIIDCTPSSYGNKNKSNYYDRYSHNTLGFVAQGSESGFGKIYACGINDSSLVAGGDQFIQVASCNTHNIAAIIKTLTVEDDQYSLIEGRFNIVRRSNDVSQSSGFVPSPEVGKHPNGEYGTHHAADAAMLFDTLGMKLNIFSSAMKTNSQYMHILHFYLKVRDNTTIKEVIDKLNANEKISTTNKLNTNEVFSFGRDHGHYGRILNQAVVSIPTVNVRNGNEITGYCFTPQDGNSLLSSVAIAEWFLHPSSYMDKIKCLRPYLFNEV
jgi:glyceraldehyde-3-phosphate dehydrogenase (NAD(P))